MKKNLSILLAAAMTAGALTACGQGSTGTVTEMNDQGKKLKVVTTIFPEYDWVREIAGDQADNMEITMLLDQGVDLHSIQPTADDIIKISECDLFIYVGGESDEWVEDALKEAVNKDMQVVNLMEFLADDLKVEEARPGMQEENGHHHGCAHFADSDVEDRTLADWSAEWQSVYPYLQDGTLDTVMEKKAESGQKTAEEYKEYYNEGYKTDVQNIVIDGENNTMAFTKNGVTAKATYEYRGYQIYDYESGNRGARFFFEAVSGSPDAPKYVQFSDHEIAPTQVEHFHIYAGNEGFDALSEEMHNWPTYYPEDMTGEEIAEEMLEHEEKEYDEHVWLSLKNARTLCGAITGALATVDPEHEADYAKNYSEYVQKLDELDMAYQTVADQSQQKTLLFGDRFPFRYMMDDYGLTYYAAFAGCSAESEASFETIVYLANKMDELGLEDILTVEKADQKIAQTIVENTKKKNQSINALDSMQSVTEKDVSDGMTYLSVMENNLEVLTEVLK